MKLKKNISEADRRRMATEAAKWILPVAVSGALTPLMTKKYKAQMGKMIDKKLSDQHRKTEELLKRFGLI